MSDALKTRSLVLCVAVFAIVAGVLAMKAIAGTATYCNDCELGSIPAVSAFHHFTSNHSSTFEAKKQQIYYYDPGSQLQTCTLGSGQNQVFGLNITCTVYGYAMTARCHLLNDGTVLATCWADWDTN